MLMRSGTRGWKLGHGSGLMGNRRRCAAPKAGRNFLRRLLLAWVSALPLHSGDEPIILGKEDCKEQEEGQESCTCTPGKRVERG